MTYEMLKNSIVAAKKRNRFNAKYIESTKGKMDIFLMNDRITEEQYNELLQLLEEE